MERHWFDTVTDRLYPGQSLKSYTHEVSQTPRYASHRLALASGSTSSARYENWFLTRTFFNATTYSAFSDMSREWGA
jgi:hypothetical protein